MLLSDDAMLSRFSIYVGGTLYSVLILFFSVVIVVFNHCNLVVGSPSDLVNTIQKL